MAASVEAAQGHVAEHSAAHDHAHDEVKHEFHLVDPSPWPAMGSIAALALTGGAVMWMHGHSVGPYVTVIGFLGVLTTMFVWWRDVLRESFEGHHSSIVNRGLRLGMLLFIASEVLFFVAFFWAFFHSALVGPDTVAASWPPEGVHPVDAWSIPFLNTMILLLSGATVTWAHHAVREDDNETATRALLITVCLGIIFTSFQVYEYIEAIHEGFTLQAGTMGSTFYMATGFHGLHVMIGTTFLIVCTMRAYYGVLKAHKHVGFEAATWYWHFVDVVWLFLFSCIYLWGS